MSKRLNYSERMELMVLSVPKSKEEYTEEIHVNRKIEGQSGYFWSESSGAHRRVPMCISMYLPDCRSRRCVGIQRTARLHGSYLLLADINLRNPLLRLIILLEPNRSDSFE